MLNELSIIVPTLNEEKYLPKLLDSIANQKGYMGKLQVVVVDGNSEDKTIEVAKKFKNKINDLLILKSARGIARQRNLGAQKAKYAYLMFIDADIILSSNFLHNALKRFNPNNKFITSFVLWGSEINLLDYAAFLIFYPILISIALIEKFTLGGIVLTTKMTHERINGYNEKLIFAEDVDYGKRTVANGAKYHLYFSPLAFYSPRRLRKVGRAKFAWLCFKIFLHMKKHGLTYVEKKFDYPFGNYNK